MNPWMKQEDDGPKFTLANNFPRTVRWGGGRGKDAGEVRADEKGEQEAAPQVEAAEEQGSEVEDGGDHEDHGELVVFHEISGLLSRISLLTQSQDSVEDAPTLEEAERRKYLRRVRRQNHPGFARQRTNVSVSSRKEPGPTEQEKNPEKPFNIWAVARLRAQRPLGEWLGVTIYTFIGIAANLAAVTSSNEAGTMETQYWAWGFATMIGECVPRSCFSRRCCIVEAAESNPDPATMLT